MTNAELNRAVKKFAKDLKSGKIEPYTDDEKAKKEFQRLHDADKTFKALNADSLRIMIVLNRAYHFINPNYFGPADY